MRATISLLSASALLLSSCASIIEGSTDTVSLTTNPPTRAACTVANGRQSLDTYAASSVTVKRSRTDLNINCADTATGATGSSKLVSDVEAWTFGNILIGGLIGLGIDWGTGAAYTYPKDAVVPMSTPAAPVVQYDPAAAMPPQTQVAPYQAVAPYPATPYTAAPVYAPTVPVAMPAPAPVNPYAAAPTYISPSAAPVAPVPPVLSPPASDINSFGGSYSVPPAPTR